VYLYRWLPPGWEIATILEVEVVLVELNLANIPELRVFTNAPTFRIQLLISMTQTGQSDGT
jgi:hypothetical protein